MQKLSGQLPGYWRWEESTLNDSVTQFIYVSVEAKDQWPYGIFHNAHHGIFCLRDGKLSLISQHHKTPRFRKRKCAAALVGDKINEWVNSIGS